MCKSLPSSALDFDLYSACPFESLPELTASVPAVTAPAVVPVEAQNCGVIPEHDLSGPCVQPEFWGDFVLEHGAHMDAPERVACGSHRVPCVHEGVAGLYRPWFYVHAARSRY